MVKRLPPWAKRPVVSAWNASIHVSRYLGEISSAILSGRLERCICCGRWRPMLLQRRSIPQRLIELWGLSPREVHSLVRKETMTCTACGAKLRARRLSSVLINTFPTGATTPKSLREWSNTPQARSLRIAEINRIEGLHEAIASLPDLSFSDFAEPDIRPQNDVPSEDLASLSYGEATFDLVLTSETLEHVPDLAAALSEIRRVLKPGGWHLFTIPIRPGVATTFARSEIGPDGEVIDHAAPIRHPGGDWGYPVFTEFGADIVAMLDQAGFDTTVHFGPTTEDDLAQVYACRRR